MVYKCRSTKDGDGDCDPLSPFHEHRALHSLQAEDADMTQDVLDGGEEGQRQQREAQVHASDEVGEEAAPAQVAACLADEGPGSTAASVPTPKADRQRGHTSASAARQKSFRPRAPMQDAVGVRRPAAKDLRVDEAQNAGPLSGSCACV
jgi:hypothetical protein